MTMERFWHLNSMQNLSPVQTSDPIAHIFRSPAEPMPPPIKEPEPFDNPDAPVREPDPEEPAQI
jgi:hypothetical protein